MKSGRIPYPSYVVPLARWGSITWDASTHSDGSRKTRITTFVGISAQAFHSRNCKFMRFLSDSDRVKRLSVGMEEGVTVACDPL